MRRSFAAFAFHALNNTRLSAVSARHRTRRPRKTPSKRNKHVVGGVKESPEDQLTQNSRPRCTASRPALGELCRHNTHHRQWDRRHSDGTRRSSFRFLGTRDCTDSSIRLVPTRRRAPERCCLSSLFGWAHCTTI